MSIWSSKLCGYTKGKRTPPIGRGNMDEYIKCSFRGGNRWLEMTTQHSTDGFRRSEQKAVVIAQQKSSGSILVACCGITNHSQSVVASSNNNIIVANDFCGLEFRLSWAVLAWESTLNLQCGRRDLGPGTGAALSWVVSGTLQVSCGPLVEYSEPRVSGCFCGDWSFQSWAFQLARQEFRHLLWSILRNHKGLLQLYLRVGQIFFFYKDPASKCPRLCGL